MVERQQSASEFIWRYGEQAAATLGSHEQSHSPSCYPREVLLEACRPCAPVQPGARGAAVQKCKERPNWGSQRHIRAEKDALPLALKNTVTGWEKTILEKNKRYCLLVLTMVCCSEAPLLCFCLPTFSKYKETHLCGHKYSCHSVPVSSCRIFFFFASAAESNTPWDPAWQQSSQQHRQSSDF